MMSVDMAQFHQVFFEESEEGLDDMEQGLLGLSSGESDAETINTIFRAAHSIKGGSATFGFIAIAEFTHVMETILDEIRNGERSVNQAVVDILLDAVDCLREMLQSEQNGSAHNDEHIGDCMMKMEQLLEEENSEPESINGYDIAVTPGSDNDGCWEIDFKPFPHFMKTGNDPIRLIKTLSDLGEISLVLNHESLPGFHEIDEELSYLTWIIRLYGNVNRTEIEEIFDWVEGDCELKIKQITPTGVKVKADTDIDDKGNSEVESAVTEKDQETQPVLEENAGKTKEADIDGKEDEVIKSNDKKLTGKPIMNAGSRVVPHDIDNKEGQKAVKPAAKSSGSIRVEIEKIDSLINMVGELVITQSMLSTIGQDFTMEKIERMQQGLLQLERHSRLLQESVMRVRMMPISSVFNRFPRLVRDLGKQLGKKVELEIMGETTELDKTVIEQIGDPLVHLVRNSMDHGIEMPEVRRAEGKKETGTIVLNAFHQGGNIVIEISDDGAGLNAENILKKAIERGLVNEDDSLADEKIYELIMMPGFSTAEQITDVSGRGVGMDVVRKNIQGLGGSISISSKPGEGSKILITLPLTLAIMDGQSVSVGNENYIVPIISIVESIQVNAENVGEVKGGGEVLRLRDEYIPVIRLASVFGIESARFTRIDKGLLVVVESGGDKCGLFVDELHGQQQVVIKSLEKNFKRMQGISGATILGDGSVAFILDIAGIVKLAGENISASAGRAGSGLRQVV